MSISPRVGFMRDAHYPVECRFWACNKCPGYILTPNNHNDMKTECPFCVDGVLEERMHASAIAYIRE